MDLYLTNNVIHTMKGVRDRYWIEFVIDQPWDPMIPKTYILMRKDAKSVIISN
jgi:hypothetical protein